MAKPIFAKGDRVSVEGQRGTVVDPDTTLAEEQEGAIDADRNLQPMRRVLVDIDAGPQGEDLGKRLVFEDSVQREKKGTIAGEVVAEVSLGG